MDKFDEQATNLLIDLGVQIAGKTKELEALRDRIGQFGREVDRKRQEADAQIAAGTGTLRWELDDRNGANIAWAIEKEIRAAKEVLPTEHNAPATPIDGGSVTPPGVAREGSGQQVREGFEILEGSALAQPCPAPLTQPDAFVEAHNAVTEIRQHLAAGFEHMEGLMRAVAGFDWGTSVSESYHNERMAAMDRLREAVK